MMEFRPRIAVAFVLAALMTVGCKSKSLSKTAYSESVETFISADSVDLCFFVIGDWGRRGKYGQAELGKTMAIFADTLSPSFIVSTGDNFYPDGVESLDDSHWRESFEEPYAYTSLQSIKWYNVLGNHDIRGNVQAQMDYHTINPIWQLPDTYYAKTFPSGNDSIALLFLETNSFATGYYQNDGYGPFVRAQDTVAQLAWLENELGKHANKRTFVVGHHPLYTAGARAGRSNSVRNHLEKRFEEYGITAYIAGHEHDVQHLKPGSVDYFVSGAGSALRDIKSPEAAIFAQSTNAFMVVQIVGNRTYASFVNTTGETIYRTVLVD